MGVFPNKKKKNEVLGSKTWFTKWSSQYIEDK